jgi:hypothetical protein
VIWPVVGNTSTAEILRIQLMREKAINDSRRSSPASG